MNRSLFTQLFIPASLLLGTMAAQGAEPAQEREAFLRQYCMDCHNLDDYAGGLAFDLLPLDAARGNEPTWEKVLTKAGVGMMPPPGQAQPPHEVLAHFLNSIEQDLADAAQRAPNPGTPSLHRLNAREYQNAIRDFLDLPIDAHDLLPADDSIEGFDNIAEGLVVSPALIQAYISVAGKISRLAVGDASISSSITAYQATDPTQAIRLEGLPLGTRGGVAAEHVFPLDGEYEISVSRSGPASFMRTPVGLKDEIEILLDGRRVHSFPPGQAGSVKVPVSAGAHTLAATFVRKQQGYGVDGTYAGFFANTRVTSLTITGPVQASGPGDTASRRRIFTCQPRESAEEMNCAREIAENLALRAYRRPVDADSLDVLMEFYAKGRAVDFDTGIQYVLARILVDPKFIYRFEEEPDDLPKGEAFRVDDFDLASRLSFFLWSSIPDDELLSLAAEGKLSEPGVMKAQVTRMLRDPKSQALVSNFAAQWLSLQLLDNAAPVAPEFDEGLRKAMREETELFVNSVLRGENSVTDLLDADYTFVNEKLARHYGIENVRGDHFRRITVPDSKRMGLLGQASILTATSAPNRTSPVQRGVWVLRTLLGAPPPDPPPGVEANIDVSVPQGSKPLSVRQRLETHRENPSCALCHGIIDPIGFALENFDLIGRWRDTEEGGPVDATARLWDGTQLFGSEQLREALVSRKELFVQALTKKLTTYALGRVLSYSDMPTVRSIVDDAAGEDYRFAALVQGIVASEAFQMRVKDANQESPTLQSANAR
jgi:mono/diheme cytochrome c family protein